MKFIDRIKNFNFKELPKKIKDGVLFFWSNVVFLAVLTVYVLKGILKFLTKMKLIGKLFLLIRTDVLINLLTKLMYRLDINEDGGVTKSYLIELAFRNMKSKKNRSLITVGGMALGVGAIVFLVSIGYGLESLVINRVAKLDELKIADVSRGTAATVKLNDELIEKIKGFENVTEVIPLVSMVAKATYNNSAFDLMSYGVNEMYIKTINPKFVTGDSFTDKDKDFVYSNELKNNVLGVKREVELVNEDMKVDSGIFNFNINEGKKVMVLEDCKIDSDPLGYVIRSEGGYVGEEKWGDYYLDEADSLVGKRENSNEEYSKWIRTKVPLWMGDNKGEVMPKLSLDNQQEWAVGCFKKENLIIEDSPYGLKNLDQYLLGDVLGEATESAALVDDKKEATASSDLFKATTTTDASGVEWVELKTVGEDDPNKMKEVDFVGSPMAEAYVSTGMLKLLGLSNNEAIGKSYKISYVVPDGTIEGINGRMQSKETEYKIKGVFEDDLNNYYYFQISDAKRLGIKVYSQLKVVARENSNLAEVRKNIEALGLKTGSTADTVLSIQNLFATLRIILGFLGTIALAVASLGMFNTMTVSLLERTREVGVMKTMGMLSNEVRELFLAESMIMGVGGGVMGILLGFSLGKLLSIVLSSISLFKGQGTINITTIPWFFTVFILVVSFFVGIITGWYPSKRARQISALNALRYE